MRVAVLASGRGSNFDALQRAARAPDYPARIVLLAADRPEAPVVEKARALGIETHVFDPGAPRGPWSESAIDELLEVLRARRIEAICLAGFMRILPPRVVQAYPHRILNIHPSLLPSFAGAQAHRLALRAGVKISGCTVHLVDEGVDTGPIVMQAAVPVLPDDTEESLAERVQQREHEIYPEALRALAEGRIAVDGRIARVVANDVVRGRG